MIKPRSTHAERGFKLITGKLFSLNSSFFMVS